MWETLLKWWKTPGKSTKYHDGWGLLKCGKWGTQGKMTECPYYKYNFVITLFRNTNYK